MPYFTSNIMLRFIIGGHIKEYKSNRAVSLNSLLRTFLFSLVAILLLVSLSACAEKSASKAKQGGTFNYFLGEPVAIDPAFAQESEGLQVTKELFDGLVDYDPETLELEPAVARKWESNSKGDTWTFWLRRGVKFHNGREVTAADFVYAWDRVAAKKTGSEAAYHLAPIKGFDKVQKGQRSHLVGVSAPSKYVLKVKLNYPFADFPTILGHPVFSPVPKEAVKARGREFAERPVGNGPFAIDGAWEHRKGITLKRFKKYYGAKNYVDAVNFKIIDNDQTGFLEFQGGGLDYSPIPSGQIKATVKQFGPNAIVGEPQLGLQFYAFNLRKPLFRKNVKLRQAINNAVDRTAIVENVYENAYLVAGGIVPPAVEGYGKPAREYTLSSSRAKRLLKEAGYPGGRGLPTIKLIYPTGRGYEGPAQIFQQNLKDIGIKVDLEGLEFGAFLKALRAGKMSMFAAGWQADYPSPDAFLYQLFYSKSGDNLIGFSDKEVDRLLIKARSAVGAVQRRRLYQKAENQILKEAPIVPYAYYGTSVVYAKRVKGFRRTALDNTPLDRVWISKD